MTLTIRLQSPFGRGVSEGGRHRSRSPPIPAFRPKLAPSQQCADERGYAPAVPSQFQPIDTARLRLRLFCREDVVPFHAYRADPTVAKYQGWSDYTIEEAREFVERQSQQVPGRLGVGAQIAIEQRSSGAMIGDVFLYTPEDEAHRAQIGYTLQPKAQGRGYATEAVRALLHYVFETLEKNRVTAATDAENERSIALLERVGMRREAHFVETVWERGQWCDEFIYAMLRREWLASGR